MYTLSIPAEVFWLVPNAAMWQHQETLMRLGMGLRCQYSSPILFHTGIRKPQALVERGNHDWLRIQAT